MPALALARSDPSVLRWLASADERLLWAILGAALMLGLGGALVGWRVRRGRDQSGG